MQISGEEVKTWNLQMLGETRKANWWWMVEDVTSLSRLDHDDRVADVEESLTE